MRSYAAIATALLIRRTTPGTALHEQRPLDGLRAIEIERIKPSGKRTMQAEEFLRGYPIRVGDRFES